MDSILTASSFATETRTSKTPPSSAVVDRLKINLDQRAADELTNVNLSHMISNPISFNRLLKHPTSVKEMNISTGTIWSRNFGTALRTLGFQPDGNIQWNIGFPGRISHPLSVSLEMFNSSRGRHPDPPHKQQRVDIYCNTPSKHERSVPAPSGSVAYPIITDPIADKPLAVYHFKSLHAPRVSEDGSTDWGELVNNMAQSLVAGRGSYVIFVAPASVSYSGSPDTDISHESLHRSVVDLRARLPIDYYPTGDQIEHRDGTDFPCSRALIVTPERWSQLEKVVSDRSELEKFNWNGEELKEGEQFPFYG